MGDMLGDLENDVVAPRCWVHTIRTFVEEVGEELEIELCSQHKEESAEELEEMEEEEEKEEEKEEERRRGGEGEEE